MEVTIYALGNVVLFERVLNAIASIFNSGMMESAALMGLLVTLVWVAANGVLAPAGKGNFNPAILLLLAIVYLGFFSGTTSPKARVYIEDMYLNAGTSTAAVDNVPIGIALPAALVSAVTFNVTEKFETAFQDVNSYVPMTDSGYTSPLRVLLSLRNPIANIDPYLDLNIKHFVKDCVQGSPNFAPAEFGKSKDAMQYLLTHYRPGLTAYYSPVNPEGIHRACDELATQLNLDTASFINSDKLTQFLNANIPVRAMKPDGLGNLRWSKDHVDESWQALAGLVAGVAQDSQQFMMNALFAARASDTYNCLASSTDKIAQDTCTLMMTQAAEQWKLDAAAAGSWFQKIMIPTMNLLLLFFYAFSPLIVIFVMVSGWHGLSILVKYLIFGIWTQTWLPTAAIINSFVQGMIKEDLTRLASITDGIAPATQTKFYDALSVKLALASELLAATPLITMALMTGSIYGLVAMAQRFSGRDYVNERQGARDISSPSSIQTEQSRMTHDLKTGTSTFTTAATPMLTVSSQVGGSVSSRSAFSERDAQTLGHQMDHGYGQDAQRVQDWVGSVGKSSSVTSGRGWSVKEGALHLGGTYGKGVSLSAEQSGQVAADASAAFSFSAGLQQNLARSLMQGRTKNLLKAGVTGAQVEQAVGQQIATLSSKDAGFASRLISGDEKAIGQVVDGVLTASSVAAIPATGGMSAIAGAGLRTMARPAIVAGARNFINTVRTQGGRAGDAIRRLGGDSVAATAVLGAMTPDGQQRASFEFGLKSQEQFRNARSENQDAAVRGGWEWSREFHRGQDRKRMDDKSIRESDASRVSGSEHLGQGWSDAVQRTTASDESFTRDSSASSGVQASTTYSPTAYLNFLRANPEEQTRLMNQANAIRTSGVEGAQTLAKFESAAKQELNAYLAHASDGDRSALITAWALGRMGEQGAMPAYTSPYGVSIDPARNSGMSGPDIGARIDSVPGMTAPSAGVSAPVLPHQPRDLSGVKVDGVNPSASITRPETKVLQGAASVPVLAPATLEAAATMPGIVAAAGNRMEMDSGIPSAPAQPDANQVSPLNQAGNVFSTPEGKTAAGLAALGGVMGAVPFGGGGTPTSTTGAGAPKGSGSQNPPAKASPTIRDKLQSIKHSVPRRR